MITISQIALFRSSRTAVDLGLAIWAALQEIEAFYNSGKTRAIFTRTFLSEGIPGELGNKTDETLTERYRKLRGEFRSRRSAKQQYARTFHYREIVDVAKEVLQPWDHSASSLIVTDLELTPPPEWRYVIFDGDRKDVAISTAPIDPLYWGVKDPNRVSIIKHRVRTSGLNAVGEFLGLSRCDNPECFLFQSIDSVTSLDSMVMLGREHGLPTLSGLGFETLVTNPGVPQPLQENPIPLATR